MKRTAQAGWLIAAPLVLALGACGGGGNSSEALWQPAPLDTERPPFISGPLADSVPYELDYGEILWVAPDGIGRLIGPDGHRDCSPLMGGYDDANWYDRYGDVPGFEGLVCNPPSVDG